ncbi:MAG: Ig-like domain-containing protein [Euryarchaeota archaeon]
MNKRLKSAAIMMALILTISVFTTLAATTTVAAHTTTTTKITASNVGPFVNKAVTFTVTLKAGATGLSKPVKIWHTQNGVRYEDGTHNTVNGVYSFTLMFGSNGQRIYHAQFAGDSESKYASSTGTVTVNVQPIPTTMTIKASKTSGVFPNDPVTFTVTLKAGSIGLSKPVKMWLYKDGVLIGNREGNTVNGVYSFTTSFTKPGKYDWYAQFAGDSPYAQANSILTVYVQPNIG